MCILNSVSGNRMLYRDLVMCYAANVWALNTEELTCAKSTKILWLSFWFITSIGNYKQIWEVPKGFVFQAVIDWSLAELRATLELCHLDRGKRCACTKCITKMSAVSCHLCTETLQMWWFLLCFTGRFWQGSRGSQDFARRHQQWWQAEAVWPVQAGHSWRRARM